LIKGVPTVNFPGYLNVGEKLQEMEEALRRADRNIAYQRELIAELERYGSATVSARATLNAFEELRKTYLARRNLLFEELANQV
jgi:hypothetical protein